MPSGEQVKDAIRGANVFDLGIIGGGILVFLFSFLPYYTVHISMMGQSVGDSATAWHGFFGWFGALLALAGAAAVALPLVGVKLPVPARMTSMWLFVAAFVCVLLAGFVWPGAGDAKAIGVDIGDMTGHGIGYWLSLIVVVVAAALSVLRKDAKQ